MAKDTIQSTESDSKESKTSDVDDSEKLKPTIFYCKECHYILADVTMYEKWIEDPEVIVFNLFVRSRIIIGKDTIKQDSYAFHELKCSNCNSRIGANFSVVPDEYRELVGKFCFYINKIQMYEIENMPFNDNDGTLENTKNSNDYHRLLEYFTTYTNYSLNRQSIFEWTLVKSYEDTTISLEAHEKKIASLTEKFESEISNLQNKLKEVQSIVSNLPNIPSIDTSQQNQFNDLLISTSSPSNSSSTDTKKTASKNKLLKPTRKDDKLFDKAFKQLNSIGTSVNYSNSNKSSSSSSQKSSTSSSSKPIVSSKSSSHSSKSNSSSSKLNPSSSKSNLSSSKPTSSSSKSNSSSSKSNSNLPFPSSPTLSSSVSSKSSSLPVPPAASRSKSKPLKKNAVINEISSDDDDDDEDGESSGSSSPDNFLSLDHNTALQVTALSALQAVEKSNEPPPWGSPEPEPPVAPPPTTTPGKLQSVLKKTSSYAPLPPKYQNQSVNTNLSYKPYGSSSHSNFKPSTKSYSSSRSLDPKQNSGDRTSPLSTPSQSHSHRRTFSSIDSSSNNSSGIPYTKRTKSSSGAPLPVHRPPSSSSLNEREKEKERYNSSSISSTNPANFPSNTLPGISKSQDMEAILSSPLAISQSLEKSRASAYDRNAFNKSNMSRDPRRAPVSNSSQDSSSSSNDKRASISSSGVTNAASNVLSTSFPTSDNANTSSSYNNNKRDSFITSSSRDSKTQNYPSSGNLKVTSSSASSLPAKSSVTYQNTGNLDSNRSLNKTPNNSTSNNIPGSGIPSSNSTEKAISDSDIKKLISFSSLPLNPERTAPKPDVMEFF